MNRGTWKRKKVKLISLSQKYSKNQVMRFADCNYIDKAECILITGSTGIGKSYIVSPLGYHACSMGYKAVYFNVSKVFTKLNMSRADGSYLKDLNKIARQHLLILDDFGLQPFDTESRLVLMELIEDRHGKGALIITSQIEQTIANAILDRIIHYAHRQELKGESMKKKRTENNEVIN